MKSAQGSKPGWIPHLHDSLPVCNEFLRFTSGVTPDLLMTRLAAEFFDTHICAHINKHWWDLNPGSRVRHIVSHC